MAPDIYALWFHFWGSDGEKTKTYCLPSDLSEARSKIVWFSKKHRMIGYTIHRNGILVEQEGEM